MRYNYSEFTRDLRKSDGSGDARRGWGQLTAPHLMNARVQNAPKIRSGVTVRRIAR